MRMMDDWIHIKLVRREATGIALPEGYEEDPNAIDTLFEVLEIGPLVKKVKKGEIIVVSFMSGMHKFKIPEYKVPTFGARESDIIGVINKAPINARESSIIT